jgi:hypothetical protein
MKVKGHGLGVQVPPGWEVRIRRRAADAQEPGGRPRPVLHVSTLALPEERGDYGSNLTPSLGPEDVFVSLFEHDAAAAETPLFATRGRPRPTPADFQPSQLQRTVPGQSGMQYFFNEHGRAFCLYVVLGSHARRAELVRKVTAVLDSLDIEPGDHA